jgi:hypothetical protein
MMTMKKHPALIAVITAFTLAFSVPAQADTVGPDGLSTTQLHAFVGALQSAVKSNSPAKVAGLVSFPLRVNGVTGKQRTVSSSSQFVADYPKIFTPTVQATVLKQDVKTVLRNSSGAMFGSGEVWVSGTCASKTSCEHAQPKVIAINLTTP